MDHRKTKDDFLHAVFVLSKSDPVAWDGFIQAFDAFVNAELEQHASVVSTDGALLVMGMGRKLVELRKDFVNIEQSEYKRRSVK